MDDFGGFCRQGSWPLPRPRLDHGRTKVVECVRARALEFECARERDRLSSMHLDSQPLDPSGCGDQWIMCGS
ncbi:hypothetical protein KM043_000426 [Ampulex compressa]|nr:hypothetical protein KM043_000426 [Ampulex compressa]